MTAGVTILRGVIPAALLADLRREADKARAIAREEHGPQAQRLQPVYAYKQLNHQVFRDFLGLPGLRAAVDGILGPGRAPSHVMGILFEPAQQAWCTRWHRDTHNLSGGVDTDAMRDVRLFNQFNAALYDDHALWVVPGSHDRDDTAAERGTFPRLPPPAPDLSEPMSSVEREMTCLAYARQMPGAVQVVLCTGDVAFYRNTGWHLGNYVPYVKRATLHDGFYAPDEHVAIKEFVRQVEAAIPAADT